VKAATDEEMYGNPKDLVLDLSLEGHFYGGTDNTVIILYDFLVLRNLSMVLNKFPGEFKHLLAIE